jgi:hypothetical protein
VILDKLEERCVGSDLGQAKFPRVILIDFHSPPSGHLLWSFTYRRLKRHFAWKWMKAVVNEFVHSCVVCQMAKPERVKPSGLLQPLPVPDETCQIITMDIIEGLPQSGNANIIMVVVDKFAKFAHFLPLKHPYTSASLAKIFLDNIYKIHGMPTSIFSDCDKVFTSKSWRELFSLAKVQALHITPSLMDRQRG